MRLPRLINYFGSKWKSARRYPKPLYDIIIEPFAGGAGYSLNYSDRQIVLIEKNPKVAGIWEYLIQATPEEILDLPDIGPYQRLDELDIDPRARNLIGFWLVGSVTTKPSNFRAPLSRKEVFLTEHFYSTWTPKLRRRIAETVQHIKRWKVFCQGYEDFQDLCQATWFIDPPYFEKKGGSSKGSKYTTKSINYEHLADWCRSLPGQVVVCETSEASWLPFKPLFEQESACNGKRYNEVIWEKS